VKVQILYIYILYYFVHLIIILIYKSKPEANFYFMIIQLTSM